MRPTDMEALRLTWIQWRSAWYNPFRMSLSSLMRYLRDENEPGAERKAYYYLVRDWYWTEFTDEHMHFLMRLAHTSDHALSTTASFVYDEMV